MSSKLRYEHTGKNKTKQSKTVFILLRRIEVSDRSESVLRISRGRKASHCFTPNVSQRDNSAKEYVISYRKNGIVSWGCSLVAKHFPDMLGGPGSVLSMERGVASERRKERAREDKIMKQYIDQAQIFYNY